MESMSVKDAVITSRVPTAPAVENLISELGIPEEGQRIAWGEIEEVIGCSHGSHRFHTVVAVWKARLLRDHNLFVTAIGNGEGLHVLPPDGRWNETGRRIENHRRGIDRNIRIAMGTDRDRLSSANQSAYADKERQWRMADIERRKRDVAANAAREEEESAKSDAGIKDIFARGANRGGLPIPNLSAAAARDRLASIPRGATA